MINIILASHGELAKGMKHSVQMIIGNLADSLEVYCLFPGMNPEDYAKEMEKKIEQNQDYYLFICDILGGSVHTALSQLCKNERVSICSGMNMNLVLSIAVANQNGLDQKGIMNLIEEAKQGITYKTSIEKVEEEDF